MDAAAACCVCTTCVCVAKQCTDVVAMLHSTDQSQLRKGCASLHTTVLRAGSWLLCLSDASWLAVEFLFI
jgi:hypothetical protein